MASFFSGGSSLTWRRTRPKSMGRVRFLRRQLPQPLEGFSARARVVAKKIHPVKVSQPEPIEDILVKLQATLGGTPPPWLRKAMLKGQERTFNYEEEVLRG